MQSDPYGEIQRLLDLLPGSTGDVLRLADHFVNQGQFDLAVEVLRRASAMHDAPQLALALGTLFGQMGRHKDAMSQMMNVLRMEPSHPEALLQMAMSLFEVQEPARAEQMLDKAIASGADPARVANLRSSRLPAQDHTQPTEMFPEVNGTPLRTVVGEGRPVGRARSGTAIGSPSFPVDEPIPTHLPKIPAQSINNLNAYDGADAGPNDSMLHEVPGLEQDPDFDRLLSDMGVPIDEPAPVFVAPEPAPAPAPHPPPPMHNADPAGPDDATMALILDDALLGASDVTAAISLDDGFMSSVPIEDIETVDPERDVPSLEYDPGFAAEISNPNLHAAPAYFEPPAQNQPLDLGPDFPSPSNQGLDLGPDFPDLVPSREPLRDDLNRVESNPAHQSPVPQVHAPAKVAPAKVSVPEPQLRPVQREPARTQRPTSPQKHGALNDNRKLFIAMIGVASVLLLCVALVAISSISEGSSATKYKEQAATAMKSDTYTGYLQGRDALKLAAESSGFLGVSLPGANGPRLREEAAADLTLVTSLLAFRFGEELNDQLVFWSQKAPPNDARVKAASIYQLLIVNRMHEALAVADKAREATPGDPNIEAARIESLIALRRPSAAEDSATVLRNLPNQSLQARLLLARFDLALGRHKAARVSLKKIIEESPNHVDAHIQLAIASMAGEKADIKVAKSTLEQVLDGPLREEASPYQVAKATAAMGRVYLAEGDAERAEVKFRDAIRLLPSRPDFYIPLLTLYAKDGRFDKVKDYLAKAKEAKVESIELTLLEAEYFIRVSQPSMAAQILEGVEVEDPRKSWLLGLSLMDLGRNADAIKALKSGSKLPDAEPRLAALAAWLKLTESPADEDADYVLKKLRDEHPDDGWTAWASASVKRDAAKRLKSKGSRNAGLREARKALAAALKSPDVNERFFFLSCMLHLDQSNGKSAESDCTRGRKTNSLFAPGAVTYARLRRFQGEYKEATEILTKLVADRPTDSVASLELARVHIAAGNTSAAEELVNKWVGRGANEMLLNLLQGRVAFARQEYTKAAGYLQKAYEMDPMDGETQVYYAWTLAQLGSYEEAGKRGLDAMRDPIWGGYGWMILGDIRRRQNRLKDAFENFAGARKSFDAVDGPRVRWSTLYSLMALAYNDKFNWDHPNVLKQLERGRDKGEPEDPDLIWVWALYELGKKQPDLNAAEGYLRKLAEVAPTHCAGIATWVKVLETLKDKPGVKSAKKVQSEHCGTL